MFVPLMLLVCAALVACIKRVYISIKNVNVLISHLLNNPDVKFAFTFFICLTQNLCTKHISCCTSCRNVFNPLFSFTFILICEGTCVCFIMCLKRLAFSAAVWQWNVVPGLGFFRMLL